MQTITISKSDFDINNQVSIDNFNEKLQKIDEPFKIKFGYPITKIPSWLFYNTNLAKIALPNSITTIKSYAFVYCTSLTEVTIPNSITKIKHCVFQNCESLTKINNYAFERCESLKEITLPNSITKIEFRAFRNCESLTEITIPSSIKYLGNNIFNKCTSLHQIIIPLSKKDFLLNIEGAQCFYDEYKDLISFEDKSLDSLLLKTNSIEQIIINLEPEH